MSLLIETIKINHGIPENLDYHNRRFNRTRKELFGITELIDLTREINIPHDFRKGICKCRIIYTKTIEEIQFEVYTFRDINSLKLVSDDLISYPYKFLNREHLNRLFALREQADDIIIIKEGFISDSSYCNLVFENKDGLFTPSTPLLKGTKREKLIKENIISELEIKKTDLQKFYQVHLINAFLDLCSIVVDIKKIG